MIKDAIKNLGKNLLKTAFPSTYDKATKLRSIVSPTPLSNDKDKPPLIRAVETLHNSVKEANEVATNSLEAQLIQNDLLGKLQGSALGGGDGILGWLEKFMPKGIGNALGVGAEVVGGGIAAKKVARMIRGKNGRYMSAAQAAANPEAVAVDTAATTTALRIHKL